MTEEGKQIKLALAYGLTLYIEQAQELLKHGASIGEVRDFLQKNADDLTDALASLHARYVNIKVGIRDAACTQVMGSQIGYVDYTFEASADPNFPVSYEALGGEDFRTMKLNGEV